MKIMSVDFEYKECLNSKQLDLVCVFTYDGTVSRGWWLLDFDQREAFKRYFEPESKRTIWVAHYAYAEVTSLLSLDIDLDGTQWVDTFIEAKLLQNNDSKKKKVLSLADLCKCYKLFDYYEHNGIVNYKDKMRDMIINNTTYTREQQKEIMEYCRYDAINGYNLLERVIRPRYEAIFKRQYDWVTATIRGASAKAEAHLAWVGLCVDTDLLFDIKNNIYKISKNFIESAPDDVKNIYVRNGLGYTRKADKLAETIERLKLGSWWKKTDSGKYSTEGDFFRTFKGAHPFLDALAHVETNIGKLKYLKPDDEALIAKKIKAEYGGNISKFYEETIKNKGIFKLCPENTLKLDSKALHKEITRRGMQWYYETKNGSPGLSKESILHVLSDHAETDNFAQGCLDDYMSLLGYKKYISSLKTLTEDEGDDRAHGNKLYDKLIGDRIHMPLSLYGTISGRAAPAAKWFIPAQAAWERCLIKPPEGYKTLIADLNAAEIWLGSLIFKDTDMLNGYASKDFYLNTGARMGMINAGDFETKDVEELKDIYGKERKLLKPVILSTNYGVGITSLSKRLYPDDPPNRAFAKTKKLVSGYKKAYRYFFQLQKKYVDKRQRPDLFFHWGHTGIEKATTAGNWKIQTSNAIVLHKLLIKLCNRQHWSKGIKVFASVHDSILVYVKDDEKLERRIDYVLRTTRKVVHDVMNYKGENAIKIGYRVFDRDEVFWDKDCDTIESIFKLINRDSSKLNKNKPEYTL